MVATLASLDGRRVQGDPDEVVLSFSNLTGTNVALVIRGGSRHQLFDPGQTASWKGVDQGASDIGVPFADGTTTADIWVLALGDLTNESGDVVLGATSASSFTARGCHATFYTDVDQGAPVRDVDFYHVTSSQNNAQNDLSGLVIGDMVTDCFIAEGTPGPPVAGGSQDELAIWDPVQIGAGLDTAVGGTSQIVATGTSQNLTWTTSSASGRSYVAVALAGVSSSVSVSSVTGSRGAGKSILPTDTNVDVQHSGADAAGTTRMFLADGADFGTATLVEQTISAITGVDLNWDAITLGPLQTGPLFLYIQIDSGGPGEEESGPFPVDVSPAEILTAARAYKCTGSESGPTVVTSDLPFVPHGAFIRVNSVTQRGVFNPQWISAMCIVDDIVAMGECAAAQASPKVVKRSQANGPNSLIVLNPTTSGAANYITATPSLTDTGMMVDFSATTADLELLIIYFGGDTLKAAAREIVINDGFVAGLPFAPDVVLGTSTNQTSGSSGDTGFCRLSMGWAKGAGANDVVGMTVDCDSTSNRNASLTNNQFLRQLSGTSITWDMTISAFTSDGITWNGSNGDSAYLLFLFLDGAQTFVNLFAKETGGVDDELEDLPDTLIDNLGWLFQMNVARSSEANSPALGARWDTGIAGIDGQHTETNMFNQASGTGTTEGLLTFGTFIENGILQSTINVRGVLTKFARVPEVQWTTNTPNAILFGLVGWESLGDITGERGVEASMLGALGVSG